MQNMILIKRGKVIIALVQVFLNGTNMINNCERLLKYSVRIMKDGWVSNIVVNYLFFTIVRKVKTSKTFFKKAL